MADMFTSDWMQSFQNVWNTEAGLSDELEKIGFTSTIAYGFVGDDAPMGVLVVENGKAVSGGHMKAKT